MLLSPHPVTLRQLQYLVAVADRLSFRAAAEACRVAQPSLSAQVAQAEDALGIQVFERDKKRVRVTPAGVPLIARARELLVQADDLIALGRALGDPLSGSLRVGVIPTIGPYLLPEVAPRLREAFARLTILWTEDKTPVLARALEAGELDAAILALEADLPDLAHRVLGKDSFVFAAAPRHRLAAAKGPLALSALDGEEVLLLDDGHCFRDQALAACARAGATEAGFRATSLQTLVQVAAQGQGVTLLPSLSIPVENRLGALRTRPFKDAPARTIALVWRRSTPIQATLDAVGEVLAKAWHARV